MKNSFFQILAVLFLLGLHLNSTVAGDKIKIRLHQPPPNMLSVSDLWKLDVTNTTRENITIYLEGTASEEKDGLIVSGKSKLFSVKPGITSYGYNDFKNGGITWKNNKYQEAIVRTGNVPTGNYSICVTGFYEDGTIADNESCIDQRIEIKSEIQISLMQPGNGDEIDTDSGILFNWTSGYKGPFKLVVVELRPGHPIDEEILNNHSFFEQKEILTNSFQYPITGPKLEQDKNYAWGIEYKGVWSDIWTFRPRPRPLYSCSDFKVNFEKNASGIDVKEGLCCYDISIYNGYNGSYTPNGFRIITNNTNIKSVSGVPVGWNQTPANVPPNTNNASWKRTSSPIPNGSSNLATVCFGDITTNPFYVKYEWISKEGKILCRDSVIVGCQTEKPYRMDSVCATNIILNGNFISGNTPGIMPSGSITNWTKGYSSPNVFNDPSEGCWDIGYIGLSGNKISGQCVKQALNPSNKILLGKKYRLTIAVKFIAQNSTLDYVKIRVIAFNNNLPSGGNHPAPATDIAIIGISPKIKECAGWTVNHFPLWIANKDFNNIAINVENNDNVSISYAYIDNVQMCDVNEETDCNGISLDNMGNPIIPSNMAPYLHPDCPPETESVDVVNGNVNDLYSGLCPGFVAGTDTWYQNCPNPCFSIGGTIPEEVTKFNCDDSLKKLGIEMSCDELQEILNRKIDIEEHKIKVHTILPPAPFNCDSTNFVPDPSLPFGGRDIVFVHGLKLDHLCDKASEEPGADKLWPDDRQEFYDNGYFKKSAEETWADHIWTFLHKQNTTIHPNPTNRYLVVCYNCNQRLESGANAILDQIREAMDNGKGVVSNGDKRGTKCFGKDYVIISHSTGGEVTDVALSIADKTTTDPILASKWGNLGFILQGLKTNIALQSALSGSNLAKLFVLLQASDLTSYLSYQLMKDKCKNKDSWVRPEIVMQSILIDLIPEYAQLRWGPYINSVPVPVLTVAGGHLMNGLTGFLMNQVHRGSDDGVLSMDCQCGNPTDQGNAPTWFDASSNMKVFDMGIDLHRAAYYYLEQKAFPLLSGSQFNAGCTPFISPTGMVEPVSGISGNSLDRWKNHYSFVQSTSDHFGGPKGNGANHDLEFNPGNPNNTTGYVSPCFDYVNSDGLRNWEESRVITDPYVYSSGLVNSSMMNKVYEEQRGLEISFTIYWPEFYNWHLKWIGHTYSFWIWKRTYHLLEGSNCGKTECDYVYENVLR